MKIDPAAVDLNHAYVLGILRAEMDWLCGDFLRFQESFRDVWGMPYVAIPAKVDFEYADD